MTNPNFRDTYKNPKEDPRDKGFLVHIHEVVEKWYSKRNGQREAVDMQVQLGIDQQTGQMINVSFKFTLRPRGLIV